jgi:hypothetical protein
MCIAMQFSCNKDALLSEKPISNIVVPSTLEDFQAIMDASTADGSPFSGEVSSDNYWCTTTFLQGRGIVDQNAYIWASDVWQGNPNIEDWNVPYKQVLIANTVLAGIDGVTINSQNQIKRNSVKGNALFMRAYAFWNLAQIFSPVYDAATAQADLGIPLRLSSDLNLKTVRASNQETYDRILADLTEAKNLVSATFSSSQNNRPSKPAVMAMLSRVYLSMRDYARAGQYADSCLQMYNALINFNTVPVSTTRYTPFALNNVETIYSRSMTTSAYSFMFAQLAASSQVSVDTLLYRSYDVNDLRKTVYYYLNATTGAININGGYNNALNPPFTGLATDEMYLVRAECAARAGNSTTALADLNTLLKSRYKGTFIPITASSSADALNKVLIERRKELPFRGLRWTDLRRLNKDGANIILARIINGQTYTLAPNDPKYVLPIPPDVIGFTGIEQNKR